MLAIPPINASGVYRLWCVKPNGKKRWDEELHNSWTIEGCNSILNRGYRRAASQLWTFGFISGSGYGNGPAITDTAVNHPGWLEFTEKGYIVINGVNTFVPFYAQFTTPTSQGRTASLTAQNPINADGNLRGVFMGTGASLLSTSILHSYAITQENLPVQDGDNIFVNYVSRLRN